MDVIGELDSAFANIRKRYDGTGPEELFHYTSVVGLVGIVSQMALWASEISCVNDLSEGQYAREMLNQAIKTAPTVIHPNAARAASKEVKGICIACFCEVHDLLSQWRAYTHGGCGYAIGVSRQALVEGAKKGNQSLFRVLYDESEQQTFLAELIHCGDDLVWKPEVQESSRESAWWYVGLHLRDVSIRLKNPHFLEEREWRLVHLAEDGALKYRVSAAQIVPYIEIRLEPQMITRIIQGPNVTGDTRGKILRKFLDSYGLSHVEIQRSLIPLRA